MSQNPYEELSQLHPATKDLSGKYYWLLLPGIARDVLTKKAWENLELAKKHGDNDYISFMQAYLTREGYKVNDLSEIDNLTSFRDIIQAKEKIKIEIKIKNPETRVDAKSQISNDRSKSGFGTGNITGCSTHSKSKERQHKQALRIQERLAGQYEKLLIKDSVIIDAMLKLGYEIPDNKYVILTDLRRSIIKYIAENDLQIGVTFKLDGVLRRVLGTSDTQMSYYDLKQRLSTCLTTDHPSSRIESVEADPAGTTMIKHASEKSEKSVKPNRIKTKIKNTVLT